MNYSDSIQTDLFDRYLAGSLSETELLLFRQRLHEDKNFSENFKQHQLLLESLSELSLRIKLREEVAALHKGIETFTPGKAVPSKAVKSLWWKDTRFKVAMAAASVAAIAILTTVFTLDYMGMLAKKQQNAYMALRKDVDNIKKSQDVLINDISSKNESPVPVTFSGTGFALTEDGLIVTSYHVIQDADSVFIENGSFQRLRLEEVAKDKTLDIAILKVVDSSFTRFATIPFGLKKQNANLGEKVYTLGFPRDEIVYGEGTVSSGSGYEGDTSSYQIALPVNPGNSGGPLLDEYGNLLGVISGKNSGVEGAAFATKSKHIVDYLSKWDPQEFPASKLVRRNHLKSLKRTDQVKKMMDFVFIVKVYNNKL